MPDDWKNTMRQEIMKKLNNDEVVFTFSYVLTGLIRTLHDKGVLSDQDREFLGEIWNLDQKSTAEPPT